MYTFMFSECGNQHIVSESRYHGIYEKKKKKGWCHSEKILFYRQFILIANTIPNIYFKSTF